MNPNFICHLIFFLTERMDLYSNWKHNMAEILWVVLISLLIMIFFFSP